MCYTVGLDLGTGGHPTALAVLERRRLAPTDRPEERRPSYSVRYLQRFLPGTGYPEVIEKLVKVMQTPPLPGSYLLIDYTGAGLPVLRLICEGLHRRVSYTRTAVWLTAGHNLANPADGMMVVAKTDVVGTLQILFQTRRLRVASGLPDAQLLVRELENYRPRVMLAKPDETAWREGIHDDLVLAVALAAWGGERELRKEGRYRGG
jgi:hypothetical protein